MLADVCFQPLPSLSRSFEYRIRLATGRLHLLQHLIELSQRQLYTSQAHSRHTTHSTVTRQKQLKVSSGSEWSEMSSLGG